MGDVDPTGDRTWRDDAYEALNADLARERFARRAIDQALLDAVNERDRLRDDLAVERQNAKVLQGYFDQAIEKAITAEAERDRLRAVVDAMTLRIRQLQHVDALLGTGDDEDEEDVFRGWWAAAVRALIELDVSPTIGRQADE